MQQINLSWKFYLITSLTKLQPVNQTDVRILIATCKLEDDLAISEQLRIVMDKQLKQ